MFPTSLGVTFSSPSLVIRSVWLVPVSFANSTVGASGAVVSIFTVSFMLRFAFSTVEKLFSSNPVTFSEF